MKTITTNLRKITAMILILAGITGLTQAQKAFVFNDIPALLAEINAEPRSEIILSVESTRTSYNIYYETEVELEDWMTNYEILTVKDQNERVMPFIFEPEEEELELEVWMVQPLLSELLAVDREDEIELESWMIVQ